MHALIAEYGARIDLSDNGGCTAIHVSARVGHANVLAALIAHAPTIIDKQDCAGQTALHLSMQSVVGFKTTAPILMQAGANVTARDKDGVTPIQHACTILALDILIMMVPRAVDQRSVLRVCLCELATWGRASDYGDGRQRSFNLILAALGHVHPIPELASMPALRRPSLLTDVVWMDDSLPPLQIIARRVIRQLIAARWLRNAPNTLFDDFIAAQAAHLPIPSVMSAYVTSELPAPNYTPGSSFNMRLTGVGSCVAFEG